MARRNVHRIVVTLSFALLAQTATVAGAAESHPCSRVQEDAARLACYDHAFGVGGAATPTTAAPSGAPAAWVGRSHGLGYNEPTGLVGSVGERVRGHRCLLAGLTGPVRRTHRTGLERTRSG